LIESLRHHLEFASSLGELATAEILREMLDETKQDAHHITHQFEPDSLVGAAILDQKAVAG
jgi:starvation-inducible DNA-binding protein